MLLPRCVKVEVSQYYLWAGGVLLPRYVECCYPGVLSVVTQVCQGGGQPVLSVGCLSAVIQVC